MGRIVDLSDVIGFQWDEGNSRKSEERHSVNQAEADKSLQTNTFWSTTTSIIAIPNSDIMLLDAP